MWRIFRKKKSLARRWVASAFIILTLKAVTLLQIFGPASVSSDTNEQYGKFDLTHSHGEREKVLYGVQGMASSRHLLFDLENCTPAAIENFPRDVFTQEERRQGVIAIHIMVIFYMFLGLAIACDEYFVPSLEGICEILKLSPDVAGATFMAAGSSAPELATTVIGVFIAKDDIGLGAVVGSAVFNIMFVISVCGLFAGMVIHLNWWPMFRDCLFYAISIFALIFVILDEHVYWYESVIFLALYIFYIAIMYFNPFLESWFTERFNCCTKNKDEQIHLVGTEQKGAGSTELFDNKNNNDISSDEAKRHEGDEEVESTLAAPKGCWRKCLWLLSLPLLVLMYFTVPDCRQHRWRNFFMITFAMSIIWISIFSYIMIWMITITGHTFNIADTVMGLTFLAAGVSVPDAIASLLVAKDGYGDMAVSNAIGSNVFDILLCMGLPWFIKTALYQPGSVVEVYSAGLTYSSITLLTTVIILLAATHINGWKLDKKYGIFLMVAYCVFMILSTLYELNIFGYVHPPTCPTDF